MRKLLVSFLVIGIAAALMGVGTFAYFSDVESSEGNAITAGVIDLEVDNQNPWTASFSEEVKPQRMYDQDFDIHMTQVSNPAKAWFRITNLEDTTGSTMDGYDHASSEPEYVAEGGTYDASDPNNDETDIDDALSEHLKVDISFDSDVDDNRMWYIDDDDGDDSYEWISFSSGNTPSTDQMLSLDELVNDEDWIQFTADCDIPDNLQPCTHYTFHLSFHNMLNGDNGDDNEHQGDTSTFDIEFYVTQTDGTAP